MLPLEIYEIYIYVYCIHVTRISFSILLILVHKQHSPGKICAWMNVCFLVDLNIIHFGGKEDDMTFLSGCSYESMLRKDK